MISLQEIRRKVDDLPPIPEVAMKLIEGSRNPDVSMRRLVELIKLEPSLCLKVLRLCNSAYYGLPREVRSIQEALVYIGTDSLVNFILAGCFSRLYEEKQEGYGLAPGDLWRHCVACAMATRRLAAGEEDGARAEAFTAGPLHDVGKIVLNTYVAQEFDEIIALVENEGLSFDQAEREIIGFSYTDVGGIIAKAWDLPESLFEAIAYHHDPSLAKNHSRLVAQVHLGNMLCLSMGIGLGRDGLAYTLDPGAISAIGLKSSDYHQLILEIHRDYRKATELVGLAA